MKNRWIAAWLTIALLFLASGCSYRLVEPSMAAGGIQNQPEVAPKDLFSGHPGTFVLRDLTTQLTTIVNEQQANKRLSPLSTFDILNALVALETGVITDQSDVKKWNGTTYPVEAWNRDHSLSSAMAISVEWYFQDAARAVEEKRMKSQIQQMGYGNSDISGGIDTFWLNSTLQISAMEQVAFVQKLYKEELPFKRSAIQRVKKLLTLKNSEQFTYAGKTGASDNLGWFVGYVTIKGKTYVFATNIEGDRDVDGSLARQITEEILRQMKLFPVGQ